MGPARTQKGSIDLRGKILALSAVVQYQDGAVVSREIVRGKAGTVTAFAFDKGQQLSEHTAPFDALAVGVDGAADVTIGGQVHPIKTGEMIIMPAGIPHALNAVARFKMMLVMIKK